MREDLRANVTPLGYNRFPFWENTMSRKKAALVSGYWSTNIGNAFFNIGGKYILEQVFGQGNVQYVQDQPGYWTFNRQTRGNPDNAFDLLANLDVDYLVLQGPMFTRGFRGLWTDTFAQLRRRGVRVILLSCAMHHHDEREIEANRQFLAEFPPFILSSRDQSSYDTFRSFARHAYSGIDSAFFVNDAFSPHRMRDRNMVAIGFDRLPEPEFKLDDGSAADGRFEFDGDRWQYSFPPRLKWMTSRGKVSAYMAHYLDRRRLADRFGSRPVVRPEHRYNPYVGWKIYKRRNSVVSDEPYTYLSLYANVALTISDRVHACVATLAYGNPAMMLSPSPRSELFDRMGLTACRQGPMFVDMDRLAEEKAALIDFLKRAVEAG